MPLLISRGRFSVADYGAVGDGVTNDTAAFNSAIAAANGESVYVPPGRYKIALSLADQNVHLCGPGILLHQQGQSVIFCARTWGSPVSVTVGTVQFGADLPSGSNTTERLSTFTLASGSYAAYKGKEVYHISSNDAYGWSGGQAWKAAFAPLLGVGLSVTGVTNGGPVEQSTLTGATSGAAGVLVNVANDGTTAQVLFHSISGNFTNGENLTIGGTTVGVAGSHYLCAATLLDDAYTTSPQLRKIPTDKTFILDGVTIEADTDPHVRVGVANRVPALELRGLYAPQIRVRVRSAWNRPIYLLSCYGANVDAIIDQLPNYTYPDPEEAYGYGVDLIGATEAARVKIEAHNLRHAVTTNVSERSYSAGNVHHFGTAKHCVIYDSVSYNSMGASFDTHPGSYHIKFLNCHAFFPRGANRTVSPAEGFQNRGFGNLFQGCTAHGARIGFEERGIEYVSGFHHRNRYVDCIATDFAQHGFHMVTPTADSNARVELVRMSVVGDGRPQNDSYFQRGYNLRGANITMLNCHAARFNGAALQIQDSGPLVINGLHVDYTDCPDGVDGIVVNGTISTGVTISNHVAIVKSATTPGALIANGAGNTAIRISGLVAPNLSSTPPSTATGAGTPTYTFVAARTS